MLKYMGNRYNFLYFEAEFKKYLIAGNSEGSTVKSYVSDLHYFFSWLQNSYQMSDLAYCDIPDILSHSHIQAYYSYLSTASNSRSTAIRRFATLRKFCCFCKDQQWVPTNPTDEYDERVKRDERVNIVNRYKDALISRNLPQTDIDRHISVIADLVINFQTL